MENALSIDLEDWYHPLLVHRNLQERPKSSRMTAATEPLLTLLKRYDVRATFFCVGEVLERHPELVQRIRGLGHEIAFHGMRHRPLWDLEASQFEAELAEFDQLVHRILGQDMSVLGFRAPTFSLDHRTRWVLPILARSGYVYDSSVFPMRGPLYGMPHAPLAPYRVHLDDPAGFDPHSPLIEAPPAVYEISGVRIPVGGGVYLRLLPTRLIVGLLKRINRSRPFVIYVHPWETDPGTPRVPMGTMARFATYARIRHTLGKLEKLLETFRFTTVAEMIDHLSDHPSTSTREAKC